jgi:hypothetical protein
MASIKGWNVESAGNHASYDHYARLQTKEWKLLETMSDVVSVNNKRSPRREEKWKVMKLNSSTRSEAAESDLNLEHPQAVEIGSWVLKVSQFSPPSGVIRDPRKRGKLTKIWVSGSSSKGDTKRSRWLYRHRKTKTWQENWQLPSVTLRARAHARRAREPAGASGYFMLEIGTTNPAVDFSKAISKSNAAI